MAECSLNSGKVSIQIQLKALPKLSGWTLHAAIFPCADNAIC